MPSVSIIIPSFNISSLYLFFLVTINFLCSRHFSLVPFFILSFTSLHLSPSSSLSFFYLFFSWSPFSLCHCSFLLFLHIPPLKHLSIHTHREVQEEHILTVGVKDRITPTKSAYARVIIKVRDYNDHAPQFLASIYNGTVTETASIGTTVVEVVAVDRDKGANGHIMYSIVSGTGVCSITWLNCLSSRSCFPFVFTLSASPLHFSFIHYFYLFAVCRFTREHLQPPQSFLFSIYFTNFFHVIKE